MKGPRALQLHMSSEAVLRVWELLGWILVCLVLGWEDARLDILLSGLPSSPHGVTLAYLVENGEELPRYLTSVAADKDNPPKPGEFHDICPIYFLRNNFYLY